MTQKYVYEDNVGRKLKAGGILIYDDDGIWVIKEIYKDTFKICDPGGKYTFEDCDIISTIAREFCEETYFSFPLNYWELKKLIETNKAKVMYVCHDSNYNPSYMSILINIKDLNDELKSIFKDNPSELFNKNREITLKHNNSINPSFYSSIDFIYILNENIRDYKIHYRLNQILQGTNFLTNKND